MLTNVTKLLEETTNQATTTSSGAGSIEAGLVAVGAGIAMIGAFGSAIGQGYAGGKTIEAISRNPESEAKVRKMFIIAAGITESAAIYCLVISLLIFFLGRR
ncbi:ATP synthase F0 subunit C [Mycoplasmopsis citelli]|uniref:ATP synthase F0 subunit C n=1 Tax=Mycoplasmopsis citelli TaxID=171281 RepID=UPI002114FF40|nr:ATP synthase F0 subunit C [Mycoplasmopsis citelli]UUD35902.1 ATP synthase F0 subunit C [Mycoplasmopsis citelli]